MITIIDDKGYIHLIPREGLITIGMHEAVPGQDPDDVKAKLIILYNTTTPVVGQMVFYFRDTDGIAAIKNVLLNWAAMDEENQLVINAGTTPPPPEPAPETSVIDLE